MKERSCFECDGCGVRCLSHPILASKHDAVRAADRQRGACANSSHLATPIGTFQLLVLLFDETCCFLDESARWRDRR